MDQIGKKVKGFVFNSVVFDLQDLRYNPLMNDYIGKEGTISDFNFDVATLTFEDGRMFQYPVQNENFVMYDPQIEAPKSKIDPSYETNGDAKHYSENRLQSIVKFERIYGTEAVMLYCEINADKYRDRLGKKSGQSLDQELMKINWYEKAAKFYFSKIGTTDEIVVNNRKTEPLPWKEK